MKMDSPSREHLEQHYSDLSELPFFGSLVDYMLMGPVVCMVWSGDDVVRQGRKMLGATKPQDSDPGTIRGDFCIQVFLTFSSIYLMFPGWEKYLPWI